MVPAEFAHDPDGYVDIVTGAMLDACAPHARWVDVFCEHGAFDAAAARAVLTARMATGLQARVHANQLGPGPGVLLACEVGAASVDHCTYLSAADVDALSSSGTVATPLPGVEFSTRSPYPDARRLIEAGVTVALASDCNPGSCFTTSMPFCIALAVREMRMTPAEASWSATAGGAAALRRTDVGRLVPGVRADLAILDAPSYIHLAYRPGVPLVTSVAGRSVTSPAANEANAARPLAGHGRPGRAMATMAIAISTCQRNASGTVRGSAVEQDDVQRVQREGHAADRGERKEEWRRLVQQEHRTEHDT